MELSLGKLTHLVWVRTFTCMVRELTLNKLNKFIALDEASTLHRWILAFRVRVWKFFLGLTLNISTRLGTALDRFNPQHST